MKNYESFRFKTPNPDYNFVKNSRASKIKRNRQDTYSKLSS